MIYALGILISLAAGFLLIRLLTEGRLNFVLHLLLALALGLGIDGTAAFYMHILFNQFNRFIPVGLVVFGIAGLYFLNKNHPHPASPLKEEESKKALLWGLLTLALLAVPLAISAHYYPLGGWDAWSCWNLKAKFIFLGKENWKDMLAPDFWRSNTNYPLLWPLVNVWFWDLGGRLNQAVPMLNSIVIALLTAGILLFGLFELTGALWPSIAASVLVTALPFHVTLFVSQYGDSLLGLCLLSAFICLLLAEKHQMPKLKSLSMVFLGMMAFTKNEGLVAAIIVAALVLYKEMASKPKSALRPEAGQTLLWFFIAALPALIFTFLLCPKNEAFINGLTSADKPLNWTRLQVILVYPWFECVSGKWNGFWLLVLGGIVLSGKKLWQSANGLIACSMLLYLAVVMTYYAVNTFFEIGWWMSNTLSRILFALTPTVTLWIGLGMWAEPTPAKTAQKARRSKH